MYVPHKAFWESKPTRGSAQKSTVLSSTTGPEVDDAPGNDQFIMVSELKPYLCILNEAKEKLPDPNTPNIQTWDSKG